MQSKNYLCNLDFPAKAKVLEFNGKFGCTICKQEGMVVKVGRGNTRVYKPSLAIAPLRNHEECYTLGQTALFADQVCICGHDIARRIVSLYLAHRRNNGPCTSFHLLMSLMVSTCTVY